MEKYLFNKFSVNQSKVGTDRYRTWPNAWDKDDRILDLDTEFAFDSSSPHLSSLEKISINVKRKKFNHQKSSKTETI